jgi:hypothetical protein
VPSAAVFVAVEGSEEEEKADETSECACSRRVLLGLGTT